MWEMAPGSHHVASHGFPPSSPALPPINTALEDDWAWETIPGGHHTASPDHPASSPALPPINIVWGLPQLPDACTMALRIVD